MTDEEEKNFIHISLYKREGSLQGAGALLHGVLYLCKIVFAIEVLLVFYFCIKKIRNYNHMLDTLFADTEEKSLHKFHILLILLLLTSLLSFGANLIGRDIFVAKETIVIPSMIFSCLIFGIGWYGLQLQFSIADVKKDEQRQLKKESPAETSPVAEQEEEKTEDVIQTVMSKDEVLSKRFVAIMKEEKMFLEHDLKLDDVVMRMGTNRTYLLQAIKSEFNMTFSEYVNRLRIKYAQQLEKEQPSISREEIALRSGYNSVSSYYRNLKKYGKE